MRAGIYTRLSHDPDGDETATARQEADCRAVCADKGWTVAAVYTDSDVSGYKKVRRPEWERLLSDVEAGTVDLVLVWKLDRLTRQPRDLERFLDVAEPRRVHIVSATEPFDLSNATGLYVARQFVSAANLYSAQNAERITRKHRAKAEAGQYAGGGVRPFGYARDGVTINSDEADLIREAVDRVLAGEGIHAIMVDWNRRGVKPVLAKRWDRTTLRGILIGPRIAGLRRHHGRVVAEAVWPAIITRDEHERLRVALDPAGRRTTPGRARRHLLSGILACGRCSASMLLGAWTATGNPIYRCPPRQASRPGCGGLSITGVRTDEWVRDAVLHRLSGDGLARARAAGDDGQHQRAAASLAADEARLQSLTHAHFVEGVVDKAGYLSARAELAERIELSRAVLSRRAGVLSSIDGDAAARWAAAEDAGDLAWRRSLLLAVLERVTVHPATRTVFDPDRLDPVWRV